MIAVRKKGCSIPARAVITVAGLRILFFQFIPYQSGRSVDGYIFGQFGR